MPDAELMAGDISVHGEVAYPEEEPDLEPVLAGIPGEPVPEPHLAHSATSVHVGAATLNGGTDPDGEVEPDREAVG
jgi:hypothetical protein